MRRPWTPADIHELRALNHWGVGYRAIALRLGRTYTAVRSMVGRIKGWRT